MRKIEKQLVEAIRTRKPFRCDNTSVIQEIGPDLKNNGNGFVFLHGNMICKFTLQEIKVSLANWPTNTTRSRIHAICVAFTKSRGIGQRKGKQFLHLPNGSEMEINSREWCEIPRVNGGFHA